MINIIRCILSGFKKRFVSSGFQEEQLSYPGDLQYHLSGEESGDEHGVRGESIMVLFLLRVSSGPD